MRKFVGILIMIVVLTGCSGNHKQNDKTVIEIFHYKESMVTGLNSIGEAFMKEHKDVEIKTQMLATDYNAELKTKEISGRLPDLFASTPGEKALKPYIDSQSIVSVSNLDIISKLSKDIRESITFSDGEIYVVPLLNTVRGIIYNERLFKEAGLMEFPKTLSEMKTACKAFKDSGITPFACAGKDGWTLGSTIFQPGHEVFSPEDFYKKRDEKTMSFVDTSMPVFDFIDLYFDHVQEDFMNTDYIGSIELYALEEAAMIVQGPWAMTLISELNEELVDVSRMGAIPFKESDNKLYYDYDAYFSVSFNADLDLINDFFNFIVDGKGRDIFSKEIRAINPYNIEFDMTKVDMDINRYLSEGMIISDTQYINMPEGFWDTFASGMQQYAMGQVSKEEMLLQFDQSWDDLTGN